MAPKLKYLDDITSVENLELPTTRRLIQMYLQQETNYRPPLKVRQALELNSAITNLIRKKTNELQKKHETQTNLSVQQ
jgi:hypothetical protein